MNIGSDKSDPNSNSLYKSQSNTPPTSKPAVPKVRGAGSDTTIKFIQDRLKEQSESQNPNTPVQGKRLSNTPKETQKTASTASKANLTNTSRQAPPTKQAPIKQPPPVPARPSQAQLPQDRRVPSPQLNNLAKSQENSNSPPPRQNLAQSQGISNATVIPTKQTPPPKPERNDISGSHRPDRAKTEPQISNVNSNSPIPQQTQSFRKSDSSSDGELRRLQNEIERELADIEEQKNTLKQQQTALDLKQSNSNYADDKTAFLSRSSSSDDSTKVKFMTMGEALKHKSRKKSDILKQSEEDSFSQSVDDFKKAMADFHNSSVGLRKRRSDAVITDDKKPLNLNANANQPADSNANVNVNFIKETEKLKRSSYNDAENSKKLENLKNLKEHLVPMNKSSSIKLVQNKDGVIQVKSKITSLNKKIKPEKALEIIFTEIYKQRQDYGDNKEKAEQLKKLALDFLDTKYVRQHIPKFAEIIASPLLEVIRNNNNELYNHTNRIFNFYLKNKKDNKDKILKFLNILIKEVEKSFSTIEDLSLESNKDKNAIDIDFNHIDFKKTINLQRGTSTIENDINNRIQETLKTEKEFVTNMQFFIGLMGNESFFKTLFDKNLITNEDLIEYTEVWNAIIKGSLKLINNLEKINQENVTIKDKLKISQEAFSPSQIKNYYDAFLKASPIFTLLDKYINELQKTEKGRKKIADFKSAHGIYRKTDEYKRYVQTVLSDRELEGQLPQAVAIMTIQRPIRLKDLLGEIAKKAPAFDVDLEYCGKFTKALDKVTPDLSL